MGDQLHGSLKILNVWRYHLLLTSKLSWKGCWQLLHGHHSLSHWSRWHLAWHLVWHLVWHSHRLVDSSHLLLRMRHSLHHLGWHLVLSWRWHLARLSHWLSHLLSVLVWSSTHLSLALWASVSSHVQLEFGEELLDQEGQLR
jgi:hypothetical protein